MQISNRSDCLHGIVNQVLCDFGYLSLTLLHAVSLHQTLISLSRNIHQFELKRFHQILDPFRFVLSARDKFVDIVRILLKTLINGSSKLFVDQWLNFAHQVTVILHDAFHNFIDS